jgi:hypothetical protein
MLFSPAAGKTFRAIFIVLIPGIIAFNLSSCGRCDGCFEIGGLAFYNFRGSELDSVIIRRYVAGTNFTVFKDSTVSNVMAGTDSMPYTISFNLPETADSLPDMLVYLPADSLTFRITNISITPAHCRRCPQIQLYTYNTYKVNGVTVNAAYNPTGLFGGFLSISK